jgi:hypothetical protein
MKTKHFVFGLMILCGTGLILYFSLGARRHRDLSDPSRAYPNLVSENAGGAQSDPNSSSGQAAETMRGGHELNNLPSPNTITNAGGMPLSLEDAVHAGESQYLAKAIQPIEFYGKAIDENGQPVQSATAVFSQTYTGNSTIALTDEGGLFSLRGVSGRYLSVNVSKDGYYISRSNRTSFDFSSAFAVECYYPNPSEPVLFHLRKKGEGAELVTSAYGVSPDFVVTPARDGTPVTVNLMQRMIQRDGQLEIRQIKPEYLESKRANAWQFQMGIKDGGFVEHNDEFPFQAPDTGYQPIVAFNFKVGEPGWTTMLRRQYYIAFGEPRRYGWLTVETRMGGGGVRLQYAINPDGPRNLEPK